MTAGGSKGRKLLQRCCSEETPSDGLNTYQVVLSLFKCVVGTGSFFLPYGIKQAGLWGGSMGLLVMGGVTIYLNWIIMEAKYKVFGKKPVSYYDLCRYLYGRGFGGLMYFSILLSNVGSCAVYLVTMGDLMYRLPGVKERMNESTIQILLLIGELFIAWLPSFKYLSWTSILGDIGLITAVVTVLWYGFTFTKIQPISHYPGFVTDTFPYFFSTAAFLYIQPSTLFPIANAMKEPKRFNIVSSVTYVFIAILNAAFATIAYMFFGDKTEDLVLENLCPGGLCTSVYVMIAIGTLIVDVFFTFPLIMAPVYELLELSLFEAPATTQDLEGGIQEQEPFITFPEDGKHKEKCLSFIPMKPAHWKRIILRTILLFFTGVIAVTIPRIGQLIALISGFTLTFNGFIAGPMVHLKMKYDQKETQGMKWMAIVWLNSFLILFGFLIGGWSVYLAIKDLTKPAS